MSDPRVQWLSNTALASLNSALGTSVSLEKLAADASVSNWLNAQPGSGAKLLSAYVLRQGDSRTLRFTNEVGALAQQQDQIAAEVHLIRLDGPGHQAAAASLNVEDFTKNVLITNTVGDAVQGLYELIHSVFAPKLLG
jgi:hypothetical protein